MVKLGRKLEGACPECGADMVLRNSKYGLFYGCTRYPECTSAHGAHAETGEPLGIPATKETKEWRMKAHEVFDTLWIGPERVTNRKGAYRIMRELMQLTPEEAHIARFDTPTCQRLIEAVEVYLREYGSVEEWRERAQIAFDRLWNGDTRRMSRKQARRAIEKRITMFGGALRLESMNRYICLRVIGAVEEIENEEVTA